MSEVPLSTSAPTSGSSSGIGSNSNPWRSRVSLSPKKLRPTRDAPPAIPPRPVPSTEQVNDASAGEDNDLAHIAPPPPPRRTHKTANNGSHASSSAATSGRWQGLFGSAAGAGVEWSKRGAERLQEHWRTRQQQASSATSGTVSSAARPGHSKSASVQIGGIGSSAKADSSSHIKLPATIFNVRVPDKRGHAFAVDLKLATERTRIRDMFHRPPSNDPVSGDEARRWLPAIAFRCIEYLDQWCKAEEGILRVPGSSSQVAQLKTLFDAGCDVDLRELHPGDLDPHAVSSTLKAWLRDLPEPLLSLKLDWQFTELTLVPESRSSAETDHGSLDQAIPKENYYLLRSLAHLLARLAQHADVTKMNLSNMILILSPTMRMPPSLLKRLVEDRENVFASSSSSSSEGMAAFVTASPSLDGSASPQASPLGPLTPSGSFIQVEPMIPAEQPVQQRLSSALEVLRDEGGIPSEGTTPIYEKFARSNSSFELFSKGDDIAPSRSGSKSGISTLAASLSTSSLAPASATDAGSSLLTAEEERRLFGPAQ